MRGKVLPTLSEAREWQLRNTIDILDGDHIDADRLKTKCREVADEWLDVRRVKLRARTISGYENVLRNWLSEWDDKPIGSITTRDVHYVFAVPGKLFSHANFYDRQWQPACVAAGRAGTRFHTLRHTFITLRAREGVAVHLLMAWAGHSNISTTMIYAHVFEDDPKDHGVAERIFSAQRREVTKPELRLVGG